MNIFLDDIRQPEDNSIKWEIITNFYEFTKIITYYGLPVITSISFDHDLGLDSQGNLEKTGYDCAKWLVDYCIENDLDLPRYKIHSANPVGAENIKSLLCNYEKHREKEIKELKERIKSISSFGGDIKDGVWTPMINNKIVTEEERNKILDDFNRFRKKFGINK